MKKQEVTNTEILEALQSFGQDIQMRFESVDERFNQIEKRMATKEDLKRTEIAIRKDMATKENLERTEAAVRKDMAGKEDLKEVKENTKKILQFFPSLIHKEDRKVNTLVERLVAKRIFARAEVEDLLDAHPLVP